METEATACYVQEGYGNYDRPSMAKGERATGEQAGGQCTAEIPPQGAPHPPAEPHCERKRATRSQGKTSGETRQDYGGRVGYNDVEYKDVMWAGNKGKWWRDDADTQMQWGGYSACDIEGRHNAYDTRSTESGGQMRSQGFTGDQKESALTEGKMTPAIRRQHMGQERLGEAAKATGTPA